MKNYLVLYFAYCCLTVTAQQNYSNEQFSKIVESEKQTHASNLAHKPFTTISDYDVTYYRCEWNADPAITYIKGEVTTYFKPLTANFDSVLFNLSDSLNVDSVKYHGSIRPFSHSGNILTTSLPSVVSQNILDSISVFYQGKPDSTGFGSFVQSTHSATNNTPVIWTLSESYGASDWWPCKNSLTDKADSIDVIITSPSAYRAASNGILVSETINGANRVCHWKHRYPIASYLICMAVTNYVTYTNYIPFNSSNLVVKSYVYPEDSASAATQTPEDVPIMQLYDTLFGLYPFANEKYGHVEAGMTMEHQTMTFFCTNCFGFETLAHELAHQWFGDKVTCASWKDIWLNEGLATYLSGIAYERMLNGVWWMPFKSSRINAITSQPGGTVLCSDTTDINRIFDSRLSYAKGAMILHQLRWIIGDSAFFAALNNYLNAPNLAYGFAHTSDLKQHFETSSGQNLTWYFNDWFTGEGFPSYQITWNQTGSSVDLTVNQTQSIGTASFFKLPLPIEFKNTTKDTIIRFDNTFSGQTYTVTIPFAVDSVKLDPDLWLITNNNTVSSVNEIESTDQILVFPNPAHEKIQILFSKPFSAMTIRLMDISGRTIKEVAVNNLKDVMIDVGNISSGLYFIRLNSGTLNMYKKIIIR